MLALALLPCAAAATPPERPDDTGWLAREVRRFRTYPHLDRAYRLVEAGRLQEARAELERCLAIDPHDLQAQSSLLVVLSRLGDHEAVVRQAGQLLQEQPRSADALRHRAAARQALGRSSEALQDLQALAAHAEVGATERRTVLASIAEAALVLGRSADALAALDRLPLAARDHRYFMRRALALERLGRAGEAETAYASAFRRTNGARERRDAAGALAELAARRGAWGEAARWNREVLASPGLATGERYRAQLLAGHAYARLGRQQQAYESFRAAAQLRPDTGALLGAATALERLGRTGAAIVDLERVLARRPDPELHLRLGVLYARAGEPGPANVHFEAALHGPLSREQRKQALDQLGFAALARGDDEQAAQYLRLSLEATDDVAGWRALAQAEAGRGDTEAAVRIHERLLADEGLDPQVANQLLRTLAHLEAGRGRHSEAAEIFLEAADRDPEAAPDLLASAAESLALAGEWRRAVAVDLRIAADAERPAAARAAAFARLGTAHARLQQPERAADALRQAIDLGRDGWWMRLDLAASLFAARRWSEALEQAQASLSQRRTAQGLLYAARCLERLGRPGLALHHLREAAALDAEMDAAERVRVQQELCFLYEQQKDNVRAAESCTRALAQAPDPELQVRLVRLLRLCGRPDAARQALSGLDLAALPVPLRAQALDETAELEAAQGRRAESIAALRRACATEETAERSYRLGLRLREAGEVAAAAEWLAAAVRGAPSEDRYREALGYAELALQRDAEATVLLQPVVERDPDYLELPRDLGYAYLRLAHNAEAARWFGVAIDNAPLYPVRSAAEETALRRDLFRLREEMARLGNRYDFAAYATVRSSDVPRGASPDAFGAGLPSETGVEIAWQPPVIGFRAERTVQAFARVLGSGPPGQPASDERSAQGGLGIRWKPLRAHDATLWAERLVRLGDRSVNDWLLRGIYSWTRGTGPEPGRRSWGYSLVQGDVARFLSARATAFYGEARQGATFNLGEGALLTPHVIVDGRREWSPFGATGWAEAGAGLSLKLLFRSSPHEAHRSSLELRVYHKRGRLSSPSGSRSFQGWVAATAVKL